MPLVTSREMFEKAYKGGYAIGAFNVNNMEIVQGIFEAAIEEKAPLIIQVSSGARKYARHEYLMHLIHASLEMAEASGVSIPVVMHLDHGDDFEICKKCIDGGFTSVMIDASKHPFEENIRITKEVVDYAHSKGVTVEAELGKLAGVEDDVKVAAKDATYTDPKEAKEFVARTGCDSLAIAIGTSHGAYKFKGEPQLAFDRLAEIQSLLPNYPLVLHGASSVPQYLTDICNQYGAKIPGSRGVPEDMIAQAAKTGVCKINVDTDLRLAMTGMIRKVFAENPAEFDPRKYLGPARQAIKDVVQHKMRIMGCSGKA
ncbi:MAG: class II fructose-1,6-bisphosphate aldolase [Candidatus Riflebacteria bacterium]|jgi:fructose-bisphosphate aldolase class II|nr:class II fructose-1,6-bisphosphate aldolase [Candidatus Riflebacteria bacterium]NLV93236.1 class II fructose-1,6-bisphosphate aldolase [Candidatus Riflebacteria bacterium]